MARTDFRATAARRLSEERELSPAIVSLLSNERRGHASGGVRLIPVERITPNPQQPRIAFDQTSLDELAASIREHGVLQPILVRPMDEGGYQLIAGERRWRASKAAGLATVPALVEEIDDDTAMEISIIENLQREDLSPLDEAAMYDRMVREHGYSIRKLAEKLGKDKGYVENRLRLADAPLEVRQLVSLRKDTLSHAYELMKVEDPRKRRRLAARVASGELSLVKLKEKIEGRLRPLADPQPAPVPAPVLVDARTDDVAIEAESAWTGHTRSFEPEALREDSLVTAKQGLTDALDELLGVLRSGGVVAEIPPIDRANLAKYLTITKLRLENAIAMVRSGEPS